MQLTSGFKLTAFALDKLESYYQDLFDLIVIIWPTLLGNKAYMERETCCCTWPSRPTHETQHLGVDAEINLITKKMTETDTMGHLVSLQWQGFVQGMLMRKWHEHDCVKKTARQIETRQTPIENGLTLSITCKHKQDLSKWCSKFSLCGTWFSSRSCALDLILLDFKFFC